mmetsp:Transcript_28092/g.90447  ORF Transcript_28092/g.90447 Transcript_28092/m.90447 type:complete len:345 (-) Transcript_28092:163-1197(-)
MAMRYASSSTSRRSRDSCGIPLARWVCLDAMPTARMCSAASAEQGTSPISLALRPAATSRTSPSCRTFGTPLARWACSAVGQMEYMPSAASVGTVPTRASSAQRWLADAQGTTMPVLGLPRARRSARSRTSRRCRTIGTPSAPLASWAAWPMASIGSAASAHSDPSRAFLVPTTLRLRRTGAPSPLAASLRSRTSGMRLVRWGCWAAGPTTFTRSVVLRWQQCLPKCVLSHLAGRRPRAVVVVGLCRQRAGGWSEVHHIRRRCRLRAGGRRKGPSSFAERGRNDGGVEGIGTHLASPPAREFSAVARGVVGTTRDVNCSRSRDLLFHLIWAAHIPPQILEFVLS